MANQDEKTKSEQRKRKMNPNSLANLRPSIKGMTNNPDGRPEGSRNLSTLLKEMLADIAPGEIIASKFVKEFCKGRKSITNADALTARLLSEGLIKGESWAIKEILDRTEGKALQSVNLAGAGGGAMQVNHHINFVEGLLKNYGSGNPNTDRD